MSITTNKKIESEIAKDVTSMNTVISNLSYHDLMELAKTKKEQEIEKVHKELTAAQGIVAALEAQLVNLGELPVPGSPKKRGRKIKNSFNPNKPTKVKKGKRGAVGQAITAFVSSKGKAGAHVKEIAAATGYKVPNITAFFYAKSNKTKFKNLGKATFALKK